MLHLETDQRRAEILYRLCDAYFAAGNARKSKQYFKLAQEELSLNGSCDDIRSIQSLCEARMIRLGSSKAPNRSCSNCGVISEKGMICEGCKKVNYCSKECQNKAWKKHKKKCNKKNKSAAA